MKIRQATIADVPHLVALNRTVQEMHAHVFPDRFRWDSPDHVVADAFAAMMQGPNSYWLIAEEEQPVGFLSAEFREQSESWCLKSRRGCYLSGIGVAPDWRHRGIARALVTALQCEAKQRRVASIELDVWAFNREARATFASLGFQSLLERMTLAVESASERTAK